MYIMVTSEGRSKLLLARNVKHTKTRYHKDPRHDYTAMVRRANKSRYPRTYGLDEVLRYQTLQSTKKKRVCPENPQIRRHVCHTR